jgi:hypothetical protein
MPQKFHHRDPISRWTAEKWPVKLVAGAVDVLPVVNLPPLLKERAYVAAQALFFNREEDLTRSGCDVRFSPPIGFTSGAKRKCIENASQVSEFPIIF